MSAVGFFIAWGNVPFAIAAGIAALFALLQVTGVMGLLAGGGEGDGDADHDAGVGHDAEADADHDADADQDADHEHDGERSLGAAALAPLGFGKIPFSIIWQTYALAFAATGFVLNLRYLGAESLPTASLAYTVPASLVAGYAAVALVARVLGPILSSKEQEATSRAQLVGQIGVVISSKVDREFGEVRIRDKTGHDVRVICKLLPGTGEPVTEHRSVVVVDYDEERGDLLVEAFDAGEEDPAPARRAAER